MTLVARVLAVPRRLWWLLSTLTRAGLLAPLRPDKYLRMGLTVLRRGITPTLGLSLAAVRSPNAVGLIDERGPLTWRQLEQRTDALAAGLAALPGGPPRTMAILCRNHRGFVESLSAAARLGADALLLNTGFSAPQITDVLAAEDADLIVYDAEFAELVTPALSARPQLRELVAWRDAQGVDAQGADAQGVDVTVDDLIVASAGRSPGRPARPGRVVLLTSGTTGTPKGARRSGGGAGTLAAVLDRIPWRAGETTVIAAPMFHAWGFGQLAISATMTCTVVLSRRFEPEATLQLVEQTGATGMAVVPVMLERIVDLPPEVLDRYRAGALRFVSASGSRMRPDAVVRFMDRFGDIVFNSYNATEAGMITIATPADLRADPETAGRPAAGVEVRIVDDQWREVAPGEVGRITVRTGSQFEGYTSGDPKAFHEGFMVTGDVGRCDAQGRLYVVGRDDEMIVSGGENVYPLEVEQTLGGHQAVREVAVIGVPDEAFGQRLAAFVVLEPGALVSADDLRRHVKERLAGYKVPRDVTLVAELPRNAAGKIVKRMLDTSPSL
jgi:acyl-CoA synthetase (AMP-forming)/AMP-acid ligase II